ncbi:glycoside hydrolase family 45 protein [Lepidopterella palustris CBS 459.81]|uniref:Glycoside hydrolase family 45 protein n=1 Tax=Lepidopterella palustris CBS 459.81 TaxID=1314670 RepID=A0A8E2E567_9PEZI|nr:glycoside hydrolase family 45 protein [Lepidopterella palustris CBS 459.81]
MMRSGNAEFVQSAEGIEVVNAYDTPRHVHSEPPVPLTVVAPHKQEPESPQVIDTEAPELFHKLDPKARIASNPTRRRLGLSTPWFWTAIVTLIIAFLVAAIVGAVVSTRSHRHHTPSAAANSSTPTNTFSSIAIAIPTPGTFTIGRSFKATFTYYGSGDEAGSASCNTLDSACGFYTSPGYAAAVSQNLYGLGPAEGAGPACGTCWRLTPATDSSGNGVRNKTSSIVVMVNHICPALGNPLCGQYNLTSTNLYGAYVDFNLCIDSGASAALFGGSGIGLAVGNATEVDCGNWNGTRITN